MKSNRKVKIKNLLFDIGGVIILSKKFNFSKFERKWSLPRGTVKEIVDSCFEKMSLSKDFNLRRYFLDNFSHLLSFKRYQEITKQIFKNERVNKTLIRWIQKKKKNYIICALTNNTAILNRLLKKKFQIYDIFDCIFNSAEIGLSKLEPNFFKYVLREIKAKPKECLFIDNNSGNIKIAKKLGFASTLFINNKDFFAKIDRFYI